MKNDLQKIASTEVRTFIRENEHAIVETLILNPPAVIRGIERLVADQITSLRKARRKWPTLSDSLTLFPPPLAVEQASSEASAKYKQRLLSGRLLTDLTGGSGIDCLFLSEGYDEVTYVEKESFLSEIFRINASHRSNIKIVNARAEDYLKSVTDKSDFFIDPSRRDEQEKKVTDFKRSSPDLFDIWKILLSKGRNILVKSSPMVDISATLTALESISEVHVLAVKNDVKELLFLARSGHKDPPKIIAADSSAEWEPLIFTIAQEKEAETSYSEVKRYLYDPSPAITKAGAFKLVGEKYGLQKLAPSTHLYTSESHVPDFPGRILKIVDRDTDKKEVKKYAGRGQINVVTKNHPLTPEQVKTKFNVRDGGRNYLYGFRRSNNKPSFLIAEPLESSNSD